MSLLGGAPMHCLDLFTLLIAIAVGFACGYLLASLGPDHHARRRR